MSALLFFVWVPVLFPPETWELVSLTPSSLSGDSVSAGVEGKRCVSEVFWTNWGDQCFFPCSVSLNFYREGRFFEFRSLGVCILVNGHWAELPLEPECHCEACSPALLCCNFLGRKLRKGTRSTEPTAHLGPICCTLVLFPGLHINYRPPFRQHSKVFLGLAQSAVVVLSSWERKHFGVVCAFISPSPGHLWCTPLEGELCAR